MRIGVLIDLTPEIEASFDRALALDIRSCQLCNWNMDLLTDEMVKRVRAAQSEKGMEISSYWAGWTGPKVWNFIDGPMTLGLLNPEYRAQRVSDLKRGGDFAKKLGVTQVATHAGFIPENPNDPQYEGMILALREVAKYYGEMGLSLLFETGQETPVTLIRAFDDIGEKNLGVNLDPANLMMYGKANPVDALLLLGEHVMDVHVKDGAYPTSGRELGEEYAVGQGMVDFNGLVHGLHQCGYQGVLTIEREITGEEQTRDIVAAKAYIEEILRSFSRLSQ